MILTVKITAQPRSSHPVLPVCLQINSVKKETNVMLLKLSLHLNRPYATISIRKYARNSKFTGHVEIRNLMLTESLENIHKSFKAELKRYSKTNRNTYQSIMTWNIIKINQLPSELIRFSSPTKNRLLRTNCSATR